MSAKTLCIENLPSHDGAADVDRLLKPFGPVRCTAMVTDPDMLRRSPGIALMEMPSARQARAAMAALDGMEYRGGSRERSICDLGAEQSAIRAAFAE